jgi:hypothetical protein
LNFSSEFLFSRTLSEFVAVNSIAPALPAARQSGLAAQAQEIGMQDHLTSTWAFQPRATVDAL